MDCLYAQNNNMHATYRSILTIIIFLLRNAIKVQYIGDRNSVRLVVHCDKMIKMKDPYCQYPLLCKIKPCRMFSDTNPTTVS